MTFFKQGQPLKGLAPGGRLVGVHMHTFYDGDLDAEAAALYHSNIITPAKGHWGTLQPSQGTFDFTEWDARTAFLTDNGLLGHWHAGLWHGGAGQPTWLADALAAISPADPVQTKALITNHFEGIQAHTGSNLWPYKYFTPVLEPIVDTGFRNTAWLQAHGDETYIDWAFQEARRLWPGLRLLLSVGAEHFGGPFGVDGRANEAITYLTDALNRGVPIDAFGIQGHLDWNRTDFQNSILDSSGLASFCQSLDSLGLEVLVTELDSHAAEDPGLTGPHMDRISAILTRDFLRIVADNCNLTAVIMWFWTDRYQTGGEWLVRKGIFDVDMQLKRERYDAVLAGVRS